VAVPARLELATFGLGNRCSILLSYGTAKQSFYFKTGHFESASMPGVMISGKIPRAFAKGEGGPAPVAQRSARAVLADVIRAIAQLRQKCADHDRPSRHTVVIFALNNRHCCVAVGSSARRRISALARCRSRRRNGSIPTQKFLKRETRAPPAGLRRIAIRTGRRRASGAKVSALLTRCLLSGD
jgi:hypothetical protein